MEIGIIKPIYLHMMIQRMSWCTISHQHTIERYLYVKGLDLFISGNIIMALTVHDQHGVSIHPSTKSPLVGTACNFSQSQARQLCSAWLFIANLRQATGEFKGNALKSFCWKRSDGSTFCVHTGKFDSGYLPEVGTNELIRKMFTDPEVIRHYRSCHMSANPACTAQFCNRLAVYYTPRRSIPF